MIPTNSLFIQFSYSITIHNIQLYLGLFFERQSSGKPKLTSECRTKTLVIANLTSFVLLRVVTSWIETREVQSEKANLSILFDKYLPACLEKLKYSFKKITPVSEGTMVQNLLHFMECLLTPENTPPDSHKELYELYFVFACVWAFGASMFQDQVGLSFISNRFFTLCYIIF